LNKARHEEYVNTGEDDITFKYDTMDGITNPYDYA
jgi:hypothetical protein